MLDVLLLRLDAPLVSFGGTVVDNLGVVQAFPGLSLLTGLLGNALGYEHRETDKLQALQARIRYAVRCDRPGLPLRDYQTVDLGQEHLMGTGWTTLGRAENRGGVASETTHIRLRDYRADSVHTVALTLTEADREPTVERLEQALREPERPLFIGRKACLPSAPLLLGRITAESLREAIRKAPPLDAERAEAGPRIAWWPADEGGTDEDSRLIYVTDERDWKTQVHTGRRAVRQGVIREEPHDT